MLSKRVRVVALVMLAATVVPVICVALIKLGRADVTGPNQPVLLGSNKFRFRSYMFNIAYSPNGNLLAVSEYNTIYLYDAATKKELRSWDGRKGIGIKSLAFSPDSKVLAVADQSPRLRLWDVPTGKPIREFDGHRSGAWFITFSPDGKWLATAGEDRDPERRDELETCEFSVRVWEASTGKESAAFAGGLHLGICAAFSPDGQLIAWGSSDGKVRVRKVAGGDDVFARSEKLEPGQWAISSVNFSTDSKLLAVGTGGVIKLFDFAAGEELKTLAHEPKAPNAALRDGWQIRFSPDGKTLGSICQGGVAIWDVESGKLSRILGEYGVRDFTFHADGKKLAYAANDHSVRFWDLVTSMEETDVGRRRP